MAIPTSIDDRIRRWGLVDTKLAQSAAFFFALVLAKLLPELLGVSVWLYVALAAGCAVRPTLRLLRSGPTEDEAGSGS
jgi:hypothetical protein